MEPPKPSDASSGETQPGDPRPAAASPPSKRWYEDGLCFDCTQCGRCCRSNGEYAHLYLTSSDVLALAGELGLSEPDFRSGYTQELDGWTTLKVDGDACTFLDAKGQCSVYEARPMQCRTWPFWRENLTPQAWQGPVQEICPGLNQGPLFAADEVDRIANSNEAWYASDGGQA